MQRAMLTWLCTTACLASADSNLQSALDTLITNNVNYWNTSLSFAVAFAAENTSAKPSVFASAAGPPAYPVTTSSRYPAGSVAKAFTSVACMVLAEKKMLDLDAPVYKIIDPWLASQKPPAGPLKAIWGGDDTINKVTARHLLQMRSGIKDYEDMELFQWTLSHPHQDFLPLQFLTTVNKTFEFAPGEGGIYSSTGYVLLGMALAAATDTPTWDGLDQAKFITESGALSLSNTRFMGVGPCTQYSDVVHQFMFRDEPYSLELSAQRSPKDKCANAGHYRLNGPVEATSTQPDAGACCDWAATRGSPGSYWVYEAGNCSIIERIQGYAKSPDARAGQVDGPVRLSDYQDLANYSCLNGWTMGNIASAPSDIALFYQALAHGQLVSQDSLAAMKHFLPLTNGTTPGPGTEYGLGLIRGRSYNILKDTHPNDPHCQEPLCVCSNPKSGNVICYSNFSTWAHPGLDWASGMPQVEYMPDLGISYAMAFNSYMGMNTSMGYLENKAVHMFSEVSCEAVALAVHHVLPDFPQFDCTQHRRKFL